MKTWGCYFDFSWHISRYVSILQNTKLDNNLKQKYCKKGNKTRHLSVNLNEKIFLKKRILLNKNLNQKRLHISKNADNLYLPSLFEGDLFLGHLPSYHAGTC